VEKGDALTVSSRDTMRRCRNRSAWQDAKRPRVTGIRYYDTRLALPTSFRFVPGNVGAPADWIGGLLHGGRAFLSKSCLRRHPAQ